MAVCENDADHGAKKLKTLKTLGRKQLLAPKSPKLSAEILTLLREHKRFSISEIETLTNANRNTIKVRLRALARDVHVTQSGKSRTT